MYDIEQEIRSWKRALGKNRGFEDGDIEELESHIRECIDRYKEKGFSDKAAFSEAIKEIGEQLCPAYSDRRIYYGTRHFYDHYYHNTYSEPPGI